jgi:multiple sugar transport system ATP-binding protein
MSITLHNLTKSFASTLVVDDLSLQIDDGEFVVLLGPSGCGKTTTLRMVSGLEQATSGDILIDGQRVNDLPPHRRDVAMVFQNYALYPHLTVAENIGYPLRVRKLSREEIQKQVTRTAATLQIEALLSRRPRELSGGERQRIALARAIVRHPRAFLMDEPLSNLDARLRLEMRAELKRLQTDLGTTTVYVTHDQAEAMTLGHRVAVMDRGRLQQFDTPLNIYNQPMNRFVAQFVGTPGMNFLNGKVDGNLFKVRAGNIALTIDQLGAINGRVDVTFGIRPKHIRVSTTEHDNSLPAKIYITELLGSETFVFLEIGNARIVARAPADFSADVGSKVWFEFDMTKTHLFDADSGERMTG